MLIEFKIQLDGNGGASVVPVQSNANPNSPRHQLAAAFPPAPIGPAADANVKKGGDPPVDGIGTGAPSSLSSSGSGTVFVIGPIVICGSGPGHTGPGGDAPVDGLGTGKPDSKGQAAAPNNPVVQNNKDADAKVGPKRARPRAK
jgi:hypothetical protein